MLIFCSYVHNDDHLNLSLTHVHQHCRADEYVLQVSGHKVLDKRFDLNVGEDEWLS